MILLAAKILRASCLLCLVLVPAGCWKFRPHILEIRPVEDPEITSVAPWVGPGERADAMIIVAADFVRASYETPGFEYGRKRIARGDLTIMINDYKHRQPQPFPWGNGQMHVVCLDPVVVLIDTAEQSRSGLNAPITSTRGVRTDDPLWFQPHSDVAPTQGRVDERGHIEFDVPWGRLVFDPDKGEVQALE